MYRLMASTPTVSFVIAAYNGAEYIAETLRSVLAQTLSDLEVIVVDDASTDNTVAVVNETPDPRIRVLRNIHNQGASSARNRGIAAAIGTFVVVHDQDDLSLPDRLERQVAFLVAHPGVVAVGGQMETFGLRQEAWPFEVASDVVMCKMLFACEMLHGTVLMRMAALRKLNRVYDPSISICADYELWTRLMEVGELANLPEVLLRYRLHGDNYSVREGGSMEPCVHAVHARLLSRLGIEATSVELELHGRLARGTSDATAGSSGRDLDDWLMRIVTANARTGLFPAATLRRLVNEVWFNACKRASRSRIRRVFRFWPARTSRILGLGAWARNGLSLALRG